MKKDKINDTHSSKPRLRVASINLLPDKNRENDYPSRESNRPRSEQDEDSEIPQFYHHPRRPRNFDPL